MSKSEILNITIPKEEQLSIQPKFPFVWCKEGLGYLGIKLTASLGTMFEANYIPALNKIRKHLKNLRYKPFSWIGRINALKINILPRIIYIFQMIPITVAQVYFRELRSMVLKYIWSRKHPKIAYATLVREKRAGGLAVPDFEKYYQAISVSQIVEWTHNPRGGKYSKHRDNTK